CLTNTLTLLLNNGNGDFTTSTLPAGAGPVAVTAADVNGDGLVDLISANSGANDLTILLNGASSYNFQKITGDGSGFTNLNASQLTGPVPGTLKWQPDAGTAI